jgi:hypothetical protein
MTIIIDPGLIMMYAGVALMIVVAAIMWWLDL